MERTSEKIQGARCVNSSNLRNFVYQFCNLLISFAINFSFKISYFWFYIQVERDDNVSILRIHDVQPRDIGEIRCTASVTGKGPSISCTAELRFQRTVQNFEESRRHDTLEINNEKPPKAVNYSRNNSLRKARRDVLSSSRNQLHESPMRIRSSSLPLRSTSSPKQLSPAPARKNILQSPLLDTRKTLATNKTNKRIVRGSKKLERKVTQQVRYKSNEHRISSSSDEEQTRGT